MDSFFSIYNSGIYFSNYDLVQIAKNLNLDLPLKSKDTLYKELVERVQSEELKSEFIKLTQERLQSYQNYANLYPDSKHLNGLIKKSKDFIKILEITHSFT